MIKFTDTGYEGPDVPTLAYVHSRGLAGTIILPVTRYLRAVHAGRYISTGRSHLDLGCGDGYFLRRSPCSERYGLDSLFGDDILKGLDFPDGYFDYVTMLAVLEHLESPRCLFEEVFRVLKAGGRLVITTPCRKAHGIIKLYARDIEDEHKAYFDIEGIKGLSAGLFEVVGYHTFILGLNQVFCLEKV